ncbi:efflux RND transporter periplasmic adaptor subunit [Legionella spiritensis]|uniref:Efflux protein n=1 Tax=Legionella spiritensis TaxID=452 RepID=A0A0W0YXU3_LEGSP|nr:efflux protein [Legionella spiritensis]SNV38827.1 efflux protein [Legionella spiritensis]
MNIDEKKIKLAKTTGMVIIICLLVYIAFFKKSATTPAIQPPSVVVMKPKRMEMVEYITQTGNTVAYNSVNLVARVEGYLNEVNFTDGTFVKKGQSLFVIEPQPYLDSLKGAEATVAAQKASLAYSKAEYARQKQMYKENATSLNSVEKWLAQTEQASAEVDKAKANENSSKINYSYTHIEAPFDGRIGRHLVDPGNLVGHGEATNLATIEQIKPIYVYFNINELDLLKIRKAARTEGLKPKDIKKIPVQVAMQNDSGFPYEGRLDFVNTGLNASTGTIEFRALLPNSDYVLLPGQFVRVRIAISQPSPQLTVPDTAIQYDQIGPYLLLVDKNNSVVLQRVTTGAVEQGMRAIVKGLKATDQVIVNGLQNAVPGNAVSPHSKSEDK